MQTSLLVLAAVVLAAPSSESGWETVVSGPVTVKARAKDGTAIQEIWAEADFDVPAKAVQDVLTDDENLSRFMPHVKEARYILKPTPDGGKYVYVTLQLPVVGGRDYIVKRNVDSTLKPNGTGEFKSRWVAAPDVLPSRHNVPRIRINTGSWKVTPVGASRSHVEYRAFLDPGGVPAANVNSGNRTEIPATLRAVEAEAKRRASGGGSDAGTPASDAGTAAKDGGAAGK